MSVRLKHDRKRDIDTVIDSIRDRILNTVPGVSVEFSQVLQDLIGDLSGVPEPIEVKVFGPDLATDERIANDVKTTLESISGVVDTVVLRSMGQPNLQITPDRTACARYGLNVGDVNSVVQAAIGGQAAIDHHIAKQVGDADAGDARAEYHDPLVAQQRSADSHRRHGGGKRDGAGHDQKYRGVDESGEDRGRAEAVSVALGRIFLRDPVAGPGQQQSQHVAGDRKQRRVRVGEA